jgi:hypothetical protein
MIVEGLVVASKVVFGHGCVYVALLVSLKTNRNQPRILSNLHVTDDKVASSSDLFFVLYTLRSNSSDIMDKNLVQLTAPTGNTAEHIATAQPTQLAGTKRKSTDASSNLPTIDLDDYDVLNGHPMDSCTVVRGKINCFLEAGEMKIGQFCDAIGVSGNAYRRFMAQNGKFAGEGCDTYQNAWLFFKKRELAGLKIPTKKQKTAAAASTAGAKKDAVTDISSIHLDGNINTSRGLLIASN